MDPANALKDELLVFLDDVNRVAQSIRRSGNVERAEAIEGYARAIVQTLQRGGVDVGNQVERTAMLPIVDEAVRALGRLFAQFIDGDEVEREKVTTLSRGRQLLEALR